MFRINIRFVTIFKQKPIKKAHFQGLLVIYAEEEGFEFSAIIGNNCRAFTKTATRMQRDYLNAFDL